MLPDVGGGRVANPLFGISQREPPCEPRAEMALLGALLTNNKALAYVEEFLRPEHFYDPLHGRVYAAVMQRVAQGGVADPLSLLPQFAGEPMLGEEGARGFLSGLVVAMVGLLNAAEYGRVIRDAWMRRQIIEACTEAIDSAFGVRDERAGPWEGPPSASPIMEALDARLLRIVEGAGDETPSIEAGESIHQALAMTEAAAQRKGGLAGITTGLPALNRMTTGLVAGDLILLGARPSMGKTALGLSIVYRAAQAGARVYMWSGEMLAPKLGARAAAAYARLSTGSVFTGRKWEVPDDAELDEGALSRADWARLTEAERAARTLAISIDCRPGITPRRCGRGRAG